MDNKNICFSSTDAYLQSAGLMENCYYDDLRMDFTEKPERSGGTFIMGLEKKIFTLFLLWVGSISLANQGQYHDLHCSNMKTEPKCATSLGLYAMQCHHVLMEWRVHHRCEFLIRKYLESNKKRYSL